MPTAQLLHLHGEAARDLDDVPDAPGRRAAQAGSRFQRYRQAPSMSTMNVPSSWTGVGVVKHVVFGDRAVDARGSPPVIGFSSCGTTVPDPLS
jgi:hypothetical protein